MSERGKYIVIEGHDGTGKSTQRDLLVERFEVEGQPAIGIHEPGETPIGLELEKMIKDKELGRTALTNLLLFTANRIELWKQTIAPALESGTHVVADRNWLSSLAYQGIAEGLGEEIVMQVTERYVGEDYMHPDLTFFMALEEEIRKSRLGGRKEEADTFEAKGDDFQTKVAKGYQVATERPGVITISATPEPKTIHEEIWRQVKSGVDS